LQAISFDARALHDALDPYLRSLAARDQFAGVVGVFSADSNKPLFHKSYGFANRSDFVPNDITTRFSTASLTCMFTAVAIAQLAEQNLVSFKSPARDYLPAISKRLPARVTIHHLLTHTSGLTDYFQDDLPESSNTVASDLAARFPLSMLRRPADFLPLILGKPLRFDPGSAFSYCSAGYILLGLIIEQLTGQSYFDHISDKIFRRAAMTDSGFFPLDAATPRRAVGYVPPSFTANIYSLPPLGTPDSGACCTAIDLARLFVALQNLHLLGEQAAQQLLHEHVSLDENQSYGYGFWLKRLPKNRQLLGHSGEEPGSSARAYRLSDPPVTIVVLSNQSMAAGPVFDHLLQTLIS